MIVIGRHTAQGLKGIAILLMLAHHLFGLPTLIEPSNRPVPLVPGLPLEYWVGRFGKICVAMFLLLSGYGFAVSGAGGKGWRYALDKGWRFLLAYWPYFLLAFVIGHLFFQERMANGNLRFPTDPVEIALNALTLRNTMAFEWWFAETYLLLVLATPLLLRAGARPLLAMAGSSVLFVAGAAMDVARLDLPVVSIANLFIWQWPFMAGIVLARLELPQVLVPWLDGRGAALLLAGTLAGFALVERLLPAALTPYLIIVSPAFVIALALLWRNREGLAQRTLRWLGGLTLGLWLVHPFFCYYFFQDQIFAPRYPPLVFVALLGASLAVVVPVERMRALLERRRNPR